MQTKTGMNEIENYLTDASNIQGGYAEKLFVPETADEIAKILGQANEQNIPVTVSGARTGTVGGAVPFGGWVISLERFNKIKSIDKEAKTAVVEPGVILADLQKAAEAEGLFYPPDPTEWSCQIGGTVATNASGARSFKYGATREYVRGLNIVRADGDGLRLTRGMAVSAEGEPIRLETTAGRNIAVKVPTYRRPNVRKNVSGIFNSRPLDAIDLFIGSEGTLGVIAEVELALLPKPEGFFSGIVFFEREGDLLAFVDDIRSLSFATRKNPVATAPGSDSCAGIDASLLEYFDERAVRFISEKFPEVPADMAGAIFFEQETDSDNEDAVFDAWNGLLVKHNADIDASWFTTSDRDRERMREFRHALPVSVNEHVVRNKQKKIGTDMAIPDDRFPPFLHFQKEMLEASGIEYVIFGHIGDCHLHANLLPKDGDEAVRSRHLFGRFIAQAILLGGCVSAEHGIGKLKRRYLDAMMGERYLNEMAEIKKAFDPKGILGRGNMFEERYLSV